MSANQYDIGLATFERIRATFPSLVMNLDLHPDHMDLAMDIPAQAGLSFNVDLNLQNRDELHLVASGLWVEWFPCTNPKKVEEYFESVCGVLSGQFRILEHWRGKRAVKSELQRPTDSQWKTVATWLTLSALIPWPRKTFKIVQNVPDAGPHA